MINRPARSNDDPSKHMDMNTMGFLQCVSGKREESTSKSVQNVHMSKIKK